jgi:acetolactate synthase-1/2/3 large subunit
VTVATPLRFAYESLTQELLALGTRVTFGVMGEDTAALTGDIAGAGIHYLGARHESAAVSMADGYAWATGELGVCLVTRGPGVTNAATAMRTAAAGRRPLLLLTGEPPRDADVRHDYKVVDQESVARAVGMEYLTAEHAGELASQLRRAAGLARAGRATVLAIPVNVLNGPWEDATAAEPEPEPALAVASEPSAAQIDEIVTLLRTRRRPLVLAGRGACDGDVSRRLERLAERTGALLGTTLVAKDLFRGHRLDLGVVGGFSSDPAYALLAEVDCVLAFGASLTPFTTAQQTLFGAAAVVQVDADPAQVGASFPVAIGVAADAGVTAERLLAALEPAQERERPQHDDATLGRLAAPAYSGSDDSREGELDPRIVAGTLDALLPADRTVVLDSGRFMTSPGRFVRVSGPDRFRLTAEAGSIAVGLGIALGAAAGRPDGTTALFIGDGGLSMALGDLETAARHELPLVVVVMNDRAYGAERVHLEAGGLPVELADLPEIDFAAVARSLGLEAAPVRTVGELRAQAPALDRRGRGPLLLDCRIRTDLTATRLRW